MDEDELNEAIIDLLITALPYRGYSVYLGTWGLGEKDGITGKNWTGCAYYYDDYKTAKEQLIPYILKRMKVKKDKEAERIRKEDTR